MPLSDYQWGRAKLFAVTEEGGHWYQKADHSVILITKETMKECEDLHIRPEHNTPGYDPIWEYNWDRICSEIDERAKAEKFLTSLTPVQIQQLKEELNAVSERQMSNSPKL